MDRQHARPPGTGSVIAGAYKAIPAAHGETLVRLGRRRRTPDRFATRVGTQPYVKIVRIDDTSLNSVGEYHIWNPGFAFAYPSLASAPNGDIGVSVSFGGSTGPIRSSTVGYLGDYVVYYVDESALTTEPTISIPRRRLQ